MNRGLGIVLHIPTWDWNTGLDDYNWWFRSNGKLTTIVNPSSTHIMTVLAGHAQV